MIRKMEIMQMSKIPRSESLGIEKIVPKLGMFSHLTER